MASQRVFRVTVRGRFEHLTESAQAALVRAQPEHDVFLSGYTAEGTFTYDEHIRFFNLRYEIRVDGDDASDASGASGASGTAASTAEREADTFLRTLGYGYHRPLKVDVVDVSAIWDDVARRRPTGQRPSR